MVKEIKFMYKTRHNKCIKVTFDDEQVNYIRPWNGWISICREHHDECREIAIQNLYWLLSLDLNAEEYHKFAIKAFETTDDLFNSEAFKKSIDTWLSKKREHVMIFDNEYEYLKENLIKDYFKNQDNYPSIVDIKKIYNLK